MSARTITAFSNPLIKRLRSLHDKKHRQAEGLFLAEGMRIIAEAVDAGRAPKVLVLTAESRSHPLARSLEQATLAAGGEVIETTDEILNKLSRKDNPQNLIAAFEPQLGTLDRLDRATAGLWLVLHEIRDPGNLGTILRTADAVGAGGVILLDQCCDPFSVEAVRATMGALFTVPLVTATTKSFLNWLRKGPGLLVAATLNEATDYQRVRYERPTFLLMGTEQAGLPIDLEQASDERVRIPMRGKADSLNVAVATAVLAYEVFNQQRTD
jgi:RNA methyltransferase, TrmH family